MTRGDLLVVDDQRDVAETMCEALRARGFTATAQFDPNEALIAIDHGSFDTVLVDLHMEPINGFTFCERLQEIHSRVPVIVVTGDATMSSAVGSLRAGAFDFATKPVDLDLLQAAVERGVQHYRRHMAIRHVRSETVAVAHFAPLLGSSSAMQHVSETIARIAPTDATVLITGESGTGKELIARAIHAASSRRSGPFVAINCAAVPATLLESELFGHARGAFTDAKTTRKGLFVEAHGGTLFLDEIGEMPLEMQVKLLRALQERCVRPIGGSSEVAFDARVVAATNVDLEGEVRARRFREDLYYRIHVCTVDVPPLRDRGGDVALLTRTFVDRMARKHHKAVDGISPAALAKLSSYPWPGNVRELENSIERAVAMTQFSELAIEDLPVRVRQYERIAALDVLPQTTAELITCDELDRYYINHVLGIVNGNKSSAARILGFDRRTLYRRLRQFALGASPTREVTAIATGATASVLGRSGPDRDRKSS